MSEQIAQFETRETAEGGQIVLSGPWTVRHVGVQDGALRSVATSVSKTPRHMQGQVLIDLSGVTALDTAGAWMVHRTQRDLEDAGAEVLVAGASETQAELIALARESDQPCDVEPEQRHVFEALAERMGRSVVALWSELVAMLNMLGLVLVVIGQVIVRPRTMRLTSVVSHMERVGLDAVPIVALLTFLIGAVLAQQGASQLALFGAEVFTVNLVSISILRELGVLITAIIVAGRSGSAFTAEIGSMKVREEIDAMRTLGMDPIAVLVAPRVIALVLMLPVLTFIADIMGLIGGGAVSYFMLDISPQTYLQRVDAAVASSTFFVGLIKAPFLAMAIAVIGCLEGMRVTGSAESVGERTTSSVVKAIFTVIVLDALFAMFFTAVGY
ncbi:MAG: ABC transporter permease [Candidatus Phaeomarinobacter sp.]